MSRSTMGPVIMEQERGVVASGRAGNTAAPVLQGPDRVETREGAVLGAARHKFREAKFMAHGLADDDARTIQAVLNGEVDRYAELVDKYQGGALKLAFSLLGNYEDAKDVSQEAFVNAYRALRRFRGGAKFSSWLFRIVVNECKDVSRHRAHRPLVVATVGTADPDGDDSASLFVEVDDPTADPSKQLANRELAQAIGRAIATLPMNQRSAFLLHHVQGFSLEETAAVMGCRVGTVKAHVFRSTERLRASLTSWWAADTMTVNSKG